MNQRLTERHMREDGEGNPAAYPIGVGRSKLGALDALFLIALHTHGDAHTTADAEGGETLLGVATLHLKEQGRQHACT